MDLGKQHSSAADGVELQRLISLQSELAQQVAGGAQTAHGREELLASQLEQTLKQVNQLTEMLAAVQPSGYAEFATISRDFEDKMLASLQHSSKQAAKVQEANASLFGRESRMVHELQRSTGREVVRMIIPLLLNDF